MSVHRLLYPGLWICLLLVIPEVGVAQQQKIGYVDTDYILSNMSEYEGIQQKLRAISSEWNSRLEAMKQEIAKLQEDFQAKEILYTEELRQQKQKEIQNKINQRQQFLEQKFGAEGEYFQQQKALLEPLQRKVMAAVNVVADREGFDFVFDRAQNSNLLFGRNQWNLNEEVLRELGVTLKQPSN